ncbi:serpin family protein [Solirubrobacter soli]|uniref:serpin family protein n=1 Tax=Solirubrobacter soli TaxID=363832 RepID=UPI00040EA438|nr:serpin family protein [Solirubrobacter soli]
MDLGPALLERLQGEVVVSPYGLARALSTIREGATGETREALSKLDPVPEVDGILSAQAVWLGKGYMPGPALKLDAGPLDLARINAWSDEKTRGMIPRILDELGDDEVFVLTDAEYLDAKWVFPFTRGERLMRVDGTFEYTEDAVRLPYRDGDLRFVARMGDAPERWSEGYGVVELPRFSTTSSLELSELLIALGLGPAFRPGEDLDELIAGPGRKSLGRVVQRARVDVDEAGTRAAATTAVTARAVAFRQPEFHLVFDRPFTWAVEHAPTGTILFCGRVLNPTERSD